MDLDKIKSRALASIKLETDKVIDLINKFDKFSKEFEIKILKSNIKELKLMYLNKELTIKDSCIIHWKQLYKWNLEIKCVTEFCYDDTMNQIELLQNDLKKYKKIEDMPLLYGIPYSCKDDEDMKGYYTSMGIIKGLQKRKQEDETIVKVVKENGGIILSRGNVPQLFLTCESVNNIFGRSLNPHDYDRSVGGSSGGDGGINLIGGAKISLTKDGAGSSRIPAIFCGLYCFKPSSKRVYDIDNKFNDLIFPKYNFVTKGPISRNLEDLITHLECYFSYNKNNKNFSKIKPKIPFNKSIYLNWKNLNKKIKIGYFNEFNFLPISEPNKNVLNEVKLKMKENYELIDLSELEEIFYDSGLKVCEHLFLTNGLMFNYLEPEKVIKECSLNKTLSTLPQFIKDIIVFFLGLLGEKRIKLLSQYTRNKHNNHFSEISNQGLLNYYKFEEIMKKKEIDVLLMPGFPFPALKHGQSENLAIACLFYLGIFNLFDNPASIIPIRLVKKYEQNYIDENNNDNILKEAKKCLQDSELSPICIQLVGLKNEEEKLMGIMHHFEKCREYDTNSLIK